MNEIDISILEEQCLVDVAKNKLILELIHEHKNKNEIVHCNKCKYYEGVHDVQGHAPCSFWNLGGVMWHDFCSRGVKGGDTITIDGSEINFEEWRKQCDADRQH